MNTVQLECFLSVAEHLNFSKASRELKITQPAVSHQIQALEEELEVKLFSRTNKSVSLTPEGILFLSDAKLILRTAMSAKERLGKHEHNIHLELGCHNHMELSLFPPVLKTLYAEFPLLRPNFHLVPFPSIFNMLENRQVHAVLGIREEQKKSSLAFRELCSVPMACVCSPEHPLARYETLTKNQLTGNFIACSPRQVTAPVYDSPRGNYELIPQGARLIGQYLSQPAYGTERVMLAFNRIIFPDGKSLTLGAMPAADSDGYAGLSADVNNHMFRLLSGAIFLGGITAMVAVTQDDAYDSDGNLTMSSAMTQAIGASLGQVLADVVERNINIAPTLEVEPGYKFNLTLVKDLRFKGPYQGFDWES